MLCRHTFKAVNYLGFSYNEVLMLVSEPEMKATTTGSDAVQWFITTKYRSGFTSLTILKERMNLISLGLVFPYFCPFFETFNEKIHRMIDTGLTKHWTDDTFNPKGFIQKQEEIGPEVLTLEHLDIAFKIIFAALMICVVAFLMEIVFSFVQKIFRK